LCCASAFQVRRASLFLLLLSLLGVLEFWRIVFLRFSP